MGLLQENKDDVPARCLRLSCQALPEHQPPPMAAAAQADPIQSLFVNKIQEYAAKKKAADGGMVDATPETQAELQAELDKVAKAFGGGPGIDMTAFPDLKFVDPAVDPINISS